MSNKKLSKAPLKEVIFHVQWELPTDEDGRAFDPDFINAFGLFAKQIKQTFPVQKQLLPESSSSFPAYTLSHQFRSKELSWPVIQFGPGAFSVNDVEQNYIWEETFRPAIDKAFSALFESYPIELKIKSLTLQYIDVVEVEDNVHNAAEYVAENFRTSIANDYPLPGPVLGLSISQSFKLEQDTTLSINIHSATDEEKERNSIVWITQVQKQANISRDTVMGWLDFGHNHCSNTFKNMLAPHFYDSFNE